MKLPELETLEKSIQFYSRKELTKLLFTIIESSTFLLENLQPLIEAATQSEATNGLIQHAIDYNNKVIELIEDSFIENK